DHSGRLADIAPAGGPVAVRCRPVHRARGSRARPRYCAVCGASRDRRAPAAVGAGHRRPRPPRRRAGRTQPGRPAPPGEHRRANQPQAAKHVHPGSLVTTDEPYGRLAEILNEVTPGTFRKKTILANSGAEAVENAVKLSRKYTGRASIICFEGGYHGRTLLTL